MRYVTEAPGKYSTEITLKSGKVRRILVERVEQMNPSARGGAYMTRWKAYNGGLYIEAYGDTRQEAMDRAIRELALQGRI